MPRTNQSGREYVEHLTTEEIRGELREIDARCRDENRNMNEEEVKRWNALSETLSSCSKRAAFMRKLAANPRNVESESSYPQEKPRQRRPFVPTHMEQTRTKALVALERYENEISARALDAMEALIEEDVSGPTQGMNARYIAAADFSEAYRVQVREKVCRPDDGDPQDDAAGA